MIFRAVTRFWRSRVFSYDRCKVVFGRGMSTNAKALDNQRIKALENKRCDYCKSISYHGESRSENFIEYLMMFSAFAFLWWVAQNVMFNEHIAPAPKDHQVAKGDCHDCVECKGKNKSKDGKDTCI